MKSTLSKFASFVIFLFILQTSAAQTYDRANDENYIHAIKLRVRSVLSSLGVLNNYKFKDAYNYTITDRYSSGEPKTIRFTYSIGFQFSGSTWSNVEEDHADVFFKDGLPYASYGDRYKPTEYHIFPFREKYNGGYHSDDDIQKLPAEDFTALQIKNIHKLYDNMKGEALSNSDSYQAVVKKLNSYPKAYDFKNCLGVVYKDIVHTKDVFSNAIYQSYTTQYDYTANEAYYLKNISNHPIIIKGIAKDRRQSGNIYTDASIRLEPGQVIRYMEFYKEYDDDSVYSIQYFGDPGIIRNKK